MPDAISGFSSDEIIELTQKRIGNDSTDLNSYLFSLLNSNEMELCGLHDWSFLHTTGTITYNSGISFSTLDDNVVDIEDIRDTENGRKLNRTSVRTIDQFDPKRDQAGDVTEYARWGRNTVYWYPTPNSSGTFETKVKIIPAFMTTGSYPTISREYQHLLLQKMFISGLQYETDDRYIQEIAVLDSMVRKAIQADMLRLETSDRLKWPQEEGQVKGDNNTGDYDQAVRSWYVSC